MAQLIYVCFRDNILNDSFKDLVNYEYDHQIKVSKPHFALKEFDKVSQLIEICNDMKRMYQKDNATISVPLFRLALEQLRVLNRIFENRTNWMIPLLYQSGEQLYDIANTLDAHKEQSGGRLQNDEEEESFLIQAGRVIHMTLNTCFKDRNENELENKKIGVFYFATLLFKLYYRIQAYGLLSNMCKVFESRLNEIDPYIRKVDNDLIIIRFKYYMGLYYGYEKNNYQLGHQWLNEAFDICRRYETIKDTHAVRTRVLLYLIPMKLMHTRQYPRLQVLQRTYRKLSNFYKPLITSICTGNLHEYDTFMRENELFLVSRNLHVTILKLRELVELKLVKVAWSCNGATTKVPLDIVARAFAFASGSRDKNRKKTDAGSSKNGNSVDDGDGDSRAADDLDELECILATLIAKNYIKGYLSHTHRVMMTSKAPFPNLVKSGVTGISRG